MISIISACFGQSLSTTASKHHTQGAAPPAWAAPGWAPLLFISPREQWAGKWAVWLSSLLFPWRYSLAIGFQSADPGRASASPGSLLEMRILRPTSDFLNKKLAVGAVQPSAFNNSSGWHVGTVLVYYRFLGQGEPWKLEASFSGREPEWLRDRRPSCRGHTSLRTLRNRASLGHT